MPVEADHLIVFALVAQTGSLSEAASQLFKSQPAISAQLKRLQEAVGEPLYTRHRYGIRLTSAGETLLPYAQSLVRALEGARQHTQELKDGSTGHLRIAASTTTAMYLLPKRLKQFSERQPGLELNILTCNTLEAVALLKTAACDVAMIEGPAELADLQQSVVARDEIVLIVTPEHPLAIKSVIAPEDLQGLATVRREHGSGTRAVVDQALKVYNVQPKTMLEAKGVDAIKEAVLQGFGAGFISKLAVQRECEMGLLLALPIAAEGFKRPLSIVHPKLELCSQLCRRFIQFMLSSPA